MTARPRDDPQVLIAGAGPTGLVLALLLVRLGVRVRIVDPAAEPGTTSRALAVQARTLEFYQQLGIASLVAERGRAFNAVNLWVEGRKAAHVSVADLGAGLSPFPSPTIFPQDEHERLLIERLSAAGVEVERGIAVASFTHAGTTMRVQLARNGGTTESCEVMFLAGCDGAHSTVREGLGAIVPRRHVRAPVLRRRRRGRRRRRRRRASRRARRYRLPRRLPAERRGTRRASSAPYARSCVQANDESLLGRRGRKRVTHTGSTRQSARSTGSPPTASTTASPSTSSSGRPSCSATRRTSTARSAGRA